MIEYNYKNCIESLISMEKESFLCYNASKEILSSYYRYFKVEGKEMFIRPAYDIVNEYSSIVILYGNTAIIYETNIDNLMIIDRLGRYYKLKFDLKSVIKDDFNINNIFKNPYDKNFDNLFNLYGTNTYYMNAVYFLYNHKSYPNLKHHIINLYYDIGFRKIKLDDSDIYFYELNKNILNHRYTVNNEFDDLDYLKMIYNYIQKNKKESILYSGISIPYVDGDYL